LTMNIVARILALLLFVSPLSFAGAQEPTILKHDGWVAALAFAPDGKTLASAGADKVVRLWEVGTWKPKGVLKGHTDCVCALAFGRESRWLATGSFDHSAKLWDLQERREEKSSRHPGVVTAVGLAGATGCLDGKIRWPFTDWGDTYQHKSWVNGLSFDRRGRFASASSDGTVCLFAEKPKEYPVVLHGGAGEVRCVTFSPDGNLLAAGNRFHTVRIWNVARVQDAAFGKVVKTITGLMSDVWSIAFSPDGKTLAAVDTDWKKPSKINLYDTTTWQERGSLPMPGEILCIAYSPNGEWLAAGSWDKAVRIFSLRKQ
jgi:WD40 repeat protein